MPKGAHARGPKCYAEAFLSPKFVIESLTADVWQYVTDTKTELDHVRESRTAMRRKGMRDDDARLEAFAAMRARAAPHFS